MSGGRAPMFGRDAETATLRQAAALAAQGNPTGVVLTGEAGVGKTRLAAEVGGELECDGAILVMSHGVQLSGGELPFAGIAEVVRGLVRTVGPTELARMARRDLQAFSAFDRAFGPERAPERTALTSALLAIREGFGKRRTVVWIVDDLQWASSTARAWRATAKARLRCRPVTRGRALAELMEPILTHGKDKTRVGPGPRQRVGWLSLGLWRRLRLWHYQRGQLRDRQQVGWGHPEHLIEL